MKALALLSGGLDSTLAIKVILEQGIEVEAVNFFTPFCQCSAKSGCNGYEAKKAADKLSVRLKIFNVAEEFLKILKDPEHGYGKNLNPCIDCRILMNKKAKDYMQEAGASFIITGEVLGQRPMSQHKAAMGLIERKSGLAGLILRPLSAKLLAPTIAEQKGWVDRQRLLEISGRSRKPQIALAKTYEINDYPCPAGGCLLTDPGFTRRMKDLLNHDAFTLNDIELLKIGRHFRLNPKAKIVVGRDQAENAKISALRQKHDLCFSPVENKGPLAIGRGKFLKADVINASKIVARYCDSNGGIQLKISNQLWPDGKTSVIEARPMTEAELQDLRL